MMSLLKIEAIRFCPSTCLLRACTYYLSPQFWMTNHFQCYSSVLYVMFQFLSILQKELANFEKNKDSFVSDFSQVIWKSP
jgi:hypothetical protein